MGKRMPLAVKKATVYIPLKYNDGSKVPRRIFLQIQDEVFIAFGGWTDEGTVKGAYRMQATGKKQVERHNKIGIALGKEAIPELRQMASRWAALLEQESIYLEIYDSIIEFIPPPGEETI